MKRLTIILTLLACLLLPSALAEEGAALLLSLPSGFYAGQQTLEVTCTQPGTRIYYTTDGSVPDERDMLVNGPIILGDTTGMPDPLSSIRGTSLSEIEQGMVDFPTGHSLRFVGILPDGSRTEVVGGTWFIGYDRQEVCGNLDVVLLQTDPQGLFDYDTGIYVLGRAFNEWDSQQTEPYENWQTQGNFTQRGQDWERPVTVELLPHAGDGFRMNMGLRIKGGASRANPQKSLRLIAREEWGPKNLKYVLFEDNLLPDGSVLAKYKSFTLRNGGNDCDFARIRDPFIQQLARGLRVETTLSRPVITFLNGEYWGLYSLTEEYSDNFLEYRYGIDDEQIVAVKCGRIEEGNDEDLSLFTDMFDHIAYGDMTDPEAWQKACEMLDMDSFVDYCAVQIYIDNQDGIQQANNWQMWRVREPGCTDSPLADGRWRMLLYDTDYSSGIYDEGRNYSNNTILTWMEDQTAHDWRHSALLFRSLIRNGEFRQKLIISLCDVRNLHFSSARVSAAWRELADQYRPLMPDTFRRFGPDWVLWSPEEHISGQLNSVRRYFSARVNSFPGIIRRAFGLKRSTNIRVVASDPALGEIRMNGGTLPIPKDYTGQYFREYPITATAAPAEGARFLRWEATDNAVLSDPLSPTVEITFTGSFTLTAVFE